MQQLIVSVFGLLSISAALSGVVFATVAYVKDTVNGFMEASGKKMSAGAVRVTSFATGALFGGVVLAVVLESLGPEATLAVKVFTSVFLLVVPGLAASGYYDWKQEDKS